MLVNITGLWECVKLKEGRQCRDLKPSIHLHGRFVMYQDGEQMDSEVSLGL